MDMISSERMESISDTVSRMASEELDLLIQRMAEAQPLLLGYLLTVGDDVYSEDERDVLLLLGVVVWRAMSEEAAGTELKAVDVDLLEVEQDVTARMVEFLDGETDADFAGTVELIVRNYNQRDVLRYVVQALMEDDEEDLAIREEHKGPLLLDLKTVISCLDQ